MGSVVVLGERTRVAGFALAGARAVVADDAAAVLTAWHDLPADVTVLVLTPAAAQAIGTQLDGPPRPGHPLVVTMPGDPASTPGRRS